MTSARLFEALDSEWVSVTRHPDAHATLASWRANECALRTFVHLDALVHFVQRRGRPVESDTVLAALIRRATDDQLAARTVLQCLLPGLLALTNAWADNDREEVDALVVARAWERIRTYPAARRPRFIALNVLLDVRKDVRRERCPAVQEEDLDGLDSVPVSEDLVRYASPAIELLAVVDEAVRGGQLDAEAARVIVLTRVADVGLGDLARSMGCSYAALRQRRLRAETALARAYSS